MARHRIRIDAPQEATREDESTAILAAQEFREKFRDRPSGRPHGVVYTRQPMDEDSPVSRVEVYWTASRTVVARVSIFERTEPLTLSEREHIALRKYACPYCGSQPDRWCVTVSGAHSSELHRARFALVRDPVKPAPLG